MIDLWNFLVSQTFGGFWLAVIGMCFLFFVILILGGVSFFDNLLFQLFFFFAMAVGYGYAIISVTITILIVGWAGMEIAKLIESWG